MSTEYQSAIETELTNRKTDHIDLAFQSQIAKDKIDNRFYYEPMISGHKTTLPEFNFAGKKLGMPLWVSSMTGGTEKAYKINHNLAQACAEFGMGMGLGSCRPLLEGNDRLKDFNLRSIIGKNLPFYANLGIAQIEALLKNGDEKAIEDLVGKLDADGLIVHVNPMQEWLQPEGDRFEKSPVDIIEELIDKLRLSIIVKEVGQGFGPESLAALLRMPITAIDFAAHGGTNFAFLELLRNTDEAMETYQPLAQVGHCASEMTDLYNKVKEQNRFECEDVIISGGIKNFLDGYYHTQKINANAIYGQASALLKHAQNDYDSLAKYINSQREGLKVAYSFLRVKH